MNFMIRTISFLALFCLIGCASSQPRPDLQPAPPPPPAAAPAAPQFWIRVVDLPGWMQAPDAETNGFLLVNQATGAQVQIATFTREQGEPRDMVGWLMVRFAAQGADIGDLSAEPGARTARLDFRAEVNGVVINGQAAAKWSGIDGIGFLLIGLWPAVSEPLVRPDFERMFGSVDLSRE